MNQRKIVCFYGSSCFHPSLRGTVSRTADGIAGSDLTLYGVAWDSLSTSQSLLVSNYRDRKINFSDASFGAIIPRTAGRQLFQLRFPCVVVPMYAYKIVETEAQEASQCPDAFCISDPGLVNLHGPIKFERIDHPFELTHISKTALRSLLPTQAADISKAERLPDSTRPYMVWYRAHAAPGGYGEAQIQSFKSFFEKNGLIPVGAPGETQSRDSLDSNEVTLCCSDRVRFFVYYSCDARSFDAIAKRACAGKSNRSQWSLEPTADEVVKLTEMALTNESLEYVRFPLDFVVVRLIDKKHEAAAPTAQSSENQITRDCIHDIYASDPATQKLVDAFFQLEYVKAMINDIKARGNSLLRRFLAYIHDNASFQLLLFQRDLETELGKPDSREIGVELRLKKTMESRKHHTTAYRSGLGGHGLFQCLLDNTVQEVNMAHASPHQLFAQFYGQKADELLGESLFHRQSSSIQMVASMDQRGQNIYAAIEYLKRACLLSQITNLPFHVASYHLGVRPKPVQLANSMLTREFRLNHMRILPWPTKKEKSRDAYQGADILPSVPGIYISSDDKSTVFEIDIMSAYPSVICEYGLCYTKSVEQLDAITDEPNWDLIWKQVRAVFDHLCEELPYVGTTRVVGPAEAAAEKKAAAEAQKTGKRIVETPEKIARRRIAELGKTFEVADQMTSVGDALAASSLPVLARTFESLMRHRRKKTMNDSMRAIFKLGANALYGSLASPFMRYSCMPLSRAATSACRREIFTYRALFHTLLPIIVARVPSIRSATFPSDVEVTDETASAHAPCEILASQTDSILIKQSCAGFRDVELTWITRRFTAALQKRWIAFGHPVILKAAVLFTTNHQILVPVSASGISLVKFSGTEVNSKSNSPALVYLLKEFVRLNLATRGVHLIQRNKPGTLRETEDGATDAANTTAHPAFVDLLKFLVATKSGCFAGATATECRSLWSILEATGQSYMRLLSSYCLPPVMAVYESEHIPTEVAGWCRSVEAQARQRLDQKDERSVLSTSLTSSSSIGGYAIDEDSMSAFNEAFQFELPTAPSRKRKRGTDPLVSVKTEAISGSAAVRAPSLYASWARSSNGNSDETPISARDAKWWHGDRLAVVIVGADVVCEKKPEHVAV